MSQRPSRPATVQDALEGAARALREGNLAEAERLAGYVLKSSRADTRAAQILGQALLLQGRPAEAITALGPLARRTADPVLETLLARALADAGRGDEALAQLRAATARRPPYPLAFLELGDALGKAGRFDEAAALREEHRRRIDRRDGPYYTAYRHFLDGAHASLEGRLDEADALYALGSEIGEPGQTGPWSQWDLGRRIMDARARGEEQQLAELADQLVARRPGSLVGVALRARAQLAAGDQAGAAATAASIDRVRIAELGRDLLGYLIVDLLAEVALRLGDAQLGRAVATVAAPWSGRVGVVGQGAIITGPTDLALGRALAAAGDLDAARAALERVETVGESQGWAAVVDRARAVLATLPDLG
jgi:tetratricopeptide (TPR) repeat protein